MIYVVVAALEIQLLVCVYFFCLGSNFYLEASDVIYIRAVVPKPWEGGL